MHKQKEALEDQVPEYGLEALVSTNDNNYTLIAALREAGERFSKINRQLGQH
ncbi:MAG TPA: hypothetical protein VJ695_02240 [Nitrososphaera sp.]|nr:hypothetical protein [Nitrososphaera sp.]